MFGFAISSSTIDILKDETYIALSAQIYTKAGGSTCLTYSVIGSTIANSISFAKCKDSDFPTISSTLVSLKLITFSYQRFR